MPGMPPVPPKPPIALSGIIGPPWVAVLEGSRATASWLAKVGDTVSRAPFAITVLRRIRGSGDAWHRRHNVESHGSPGLAMTARSAYAVMCALGVTLADVTTSIPALAQPPVAQERRST